MDELTQAFRDFAREIGCRTDELVPHVVNHVWCQAVVGLVIGAVLGVLGLVCAGIYFRGLRAYLSLKPSEQTDAKDTMFILTGVLCATLLIVGVVAFSVHAYTGVPAIMDPVGATVRTVIGK